jgi:hypothetical protein
LVTDAQPADLIAFDPATVRDEIFQQGGFRMSEATSGN